MPKTFKIGLQKAGFIFLGSNISGDSCVGTEAALQPLIQLYSIYIGLVIAEKNGVGSDWKVTLSAFMDQNWTQLFALLQQSNYIPQIWSFISSVGSIAWSFQENYARKKFGQMSYFSRFVYFVYVLLAVISRIVSIELMLVSLGPGYFLMVYCIIGGHLMTIIVLGWLSTFINLFGLAQK